MTEDSIFASALSKSIPEERVAFLDRTCAGDTELRVRIERRLVAHALLGQAPTLESASVYTMSEEEHSAGSSAKEGPGSLIGPYKLIKAIGAGGMGAVYLAEQQFPVRRQVALKIIKQGMDTEQVIIRFEAERQALALMDHPNIAKVLDAGTTASGRPYFVMELVNGVPITRHCNDNRLTVRERLALFVQVCQAIQHAHQKGIIHRDIKPSNVLVANYDGKSVPKVIDFGIAKATGQGLSEQTLLTKIGSVIGTLEYMSPEQAESTGLDIDTRSDIYSLGALLYELLTGTTPLESADFQKATYLEVLRKIREDEPPIPSSRLSQSKETLSATSEQRKTDPGKLPKLIQGELDWIVMKALEKDRTRRYETASGFARDVERYLSGDPVEAGPPSATYRFKKFANKNKVLIGTASAFALILILGVVVSTWQAVRARRAERAAKIERDRADSEAATAKAVTDFLRDGLLSQASAQQQSGVNEKPDPDVKVRTLLDRAAATISTKFSAQPLVEAGVRGTIGNTYRDLNMLAQAQEQYQKAYEVSRKNRGEEDPDTLIALGNLATLAADQGKWPEAAQLHQKVADTMARTLGPDDHRTVAAQQSLAVSYLQLGEYPKAEALLKKVFEQQLRTLGLDNQATLDTSDSLASVYRAQGKYKDAEPLLLNGLESYKRISGPNHPFTLREMYGLASIYVGEEKYALAEPLFLKVLEENTKLLGAQHPDTLSTMQAVAGLYGKEGKVAEGLALQEKAHAGYISALGADHPRTLIAEGDLAQNYVRAGQNVKAERTFKDVLSRQIRIMGPGHPSTLMDMSNLAYFYETHGNYGQAIPIQIQIKDIATKKFGPQDRNVLVATTTLGKDYLALRQYAKAEPPLREALAISLKARPDAWQRFYTESLLGGALLAQKKYAEAEPHIVNGYEGMKEREPKLLSAAKPLLVETGQRVVQLYQSWNKREKAAEWSAKIGAPAADAAAPNPEAKH